eukprot:gb/GECG01008118.1/.p1 GENE.gb/GECG01008118.1/~~gb/GECG01008118.1/.p1  ORF type:complete len:791 (+),score=97.90 gb/GECG01008118.1/:1-2373(+)
MAQTMGKFKLYAVPKDTRSLQVQIAASLLCGGEKEGNFEVVYLDPETTPGSSEHGSTQWPMLETANGDTIRGNGSILKYLLQNASSQRQNASSTIVSAKLTSEKASEIEEWIDFAVNEIEPRAAVLTGDSITNADGSTGPMTASHSSSDIESAKAAAYQQLPSRIDRLDKHLEMNMYLVGERLTLADVAVAIAMVPLFERVLPRDARTKSAPNVFRWWMTCVNQPLFFDMLGDCSSRLFEGPSPTTTGGAANPKQAFPNAEDDSPPAGKQTTETRAEELKHEQGAHAHAAHPSPAIPDRKYFRRRTRIANLLESPEESVVGRHVTVSGWLKRVAAQGTALLFIAVNDGSCFTSLQVIVEKEQCPDAFEQLEKCGGPGSSACFEGAIQKSPAKGQNIEMKVEKARLLGGVADPAHYPIKASKKGHEPKPETVRPYQHLRPRTNVTGAVTRIRNALSYATHRFFQERGFLYIHTPIITCNDCEGAGEQFAVTTLLPEDPTGDVERDPETKAISYKKDFFGNKAGLTVSGQLQVESFCISMSDVYTFGPTFRAENSHTTRHLSEFWMIEPEIAFADLKDDVDLAEDYLKFCTLYVLDNCNEDLQFFETKFEPGLRERLRNVAENPFARITYTEAVEILQKATSGKKKNPKFPDLKWGQDLASEQEKYLTGEVFKKPVVVTDYPKDIKAFYMKVNDVTDKEKQTVAAMDVLVPEIGEIIGGSQREDDIDVLDARMDEVGTSKESLAWYRDLRRYGSAPHAGFGLGFERLVMYVTGIENIRDVIPFPRYPGHADF